MFRLFYYTGLLQGVLPSREDINTMLMNDKNYYCSLLITVLYNAGEKDLYKR